MGFTDRCGRRLCGLVLIGGIVSSQCALAEDWAITLSGQVMFNIAERNNSPGGPALTLGWSGNLALPNPVVFPVSLRPSAIDGSWRNWNDVLIWRQPTVAFSYGWQYFDLANDLFTGNAVSVGDAWNCWKDAFNGGPTERSINIPALPQFFSGPVRSALEIVGASGGSLAASIPMRFAVDVDPDAALILNQPAVLQRLDVFGAIDQQNTLQIRDRISNSGVLYCRRAVQIDGSASFINESTGVLQLAGGVIEPGTGSGGWLDNFGTVLASESLGSITTPIRNHGTVQATSGARLTISDLTAMPGSTLSVAGSGTAITVSGIRASRFECAGEDDGMIIIGSYSTLLGAQLSGEFSSRGGGGSVILDRAGVQRGAAATLAMAETMPAVLPRFGARLTVDGDLVNQGAFSWDDGEMSGVGRFENRGERFSINYPILGQANYKSLQRLLFVNSGRVTQRSGSRVSVGLGAVIRNESDALWCLEGSSAVERGPSDGNERFENNGTIRAADAANVGISIPLDNFGTVSVLDGARLSLTDYLHGQSAMIFVSGVDSTVTLSKVRGDGAEFTGEDGGRVVIRDHAGAMAGEFVGRGAGSVVLDRAGVQRGSTATLSMAKTMPATIREFGSIVQVDGTLVNRGAFEWEGGTIQGVGLIVNDRANLVARNNFFANQKRLQQATLVNTGHVVHRDGAWVWLSQGAEVRNEPSALWLFESGGGLNGTPAERFYNFGTIRCQGGTWQSSPRSQIMMPLINRGVIDVQRYAYLSIGSYGDDGGLIETEPSSTVYLGSDPIEIATGGLAGSGTFVGNLRVGGFIRSSSSGEPLCVNGTMELLPSSVVNVLVGGQTVAIAVSGGLALDGALRVYRSAALYPVPTEFKVISAKAVSGAFRQVLPPPRYTATVRYAPDGVYLTLFPTCLSDLNEDGLVEDADFSIFVRAYDLVDCADPVMAIGCPADLDRSGVVDDADFQVFVGQYDRVLCP